MDATALHEQLIRLANDFGASSEFARAGGGNASVKHDGVLHIKPSGTTLATLRDEDLVPLRVDVLLEALTSTDSDDGDPVMAAAAAARIGDPGGRRPSVEILFHALIPDALVLHLHPLVANAVTCHAEGAEVARDLLGDDVVWVDYIDPGVPLARGIDAARVAYEARTGQPAPAITLLGNHGIIVSGNTYDEVAERTRWLTETVADAIASSPAAPEAEPLADLDVDAIADAFLVATGQAAVAHTRDDDVRTAAGASSGPVAQGPLIPDQIVYAGSLPVVLDGGDDVAAAVQSFRTTHGRAPVVAVVPGQLVVAVGATDKAAHNALDTYADALRLARDAERLGGLRVMDARERHFIENWEAEAYRQSVAAEG